MSAGRESPEGGAERRVRLPFLLAQFLSWVAPRPCAMSWIGKPMPEHPKRGDNPCDPKWGIFLTPAEVRWPLGKADWAWQRRRTSGDPPP